VNTFVVNAELVHLAIELAASEAAKREVIRQFKEQYPDVSLMLPDCNVSFTGFDDMTFDIPGYKVERK
jgi:hypothetical protein